MLGCEIGPPVRLYLLDVDVEVEARLREGVGAGGFEGLAFAEDFLLLYVPRDTRDARERAWMRMEKLRHELAHATFAALPKDTQLQLPTVSARLPAAR